MTPVPRRRDAAAARVPTVHCARRPAVPGGDPAAAFAALAATGEPAWLWWTPDGDAVLGAGTAVRIGGDDTVDCAGSDGLPAGTDPARFAAVGTLRDAVDARATGDAPTWFTTFAFAPGASLPAPWTAFRRNEATVPAVVLDRHDTDGWAVTTAVPRAGHDDDTGTDDATATTIARCLDAVSRPTAVRDAPSARRVDARTSARDAWRDAVHAALDRIVAGDADKLVLARELQVRGDRPFDVADAIGRLRRRQPSAYVFAVAHGSTVFCGASPELLVRSDGRTVRSLPLAGTARHSGVHAGSLTSDPKSRHEHGLLADAVRDALAPFCSTVESDAAPTEHASGPVVHLATQVHGTLRGDVAVTDLLAALHPTPAVGAAPREAAAALRGIDGVERGLYAGAVGTMRGDAAEFALALRCGVLDRTDATLYAGAGIVRGSDPEAEFVETEDKFVTMLDALHVVDDADATDRASA